MSKKKVHEIQAISRLDQENLKVIGTSITQDTFRRIFYSRSLILHSRTSAQIINQVFPGALVYTQLLSDHRENNLREY